MLKKSRLFIIFAAALAIASCNASGYDGEWYESGRPVDENLSDVFYICATEVLHSYDTDSNEVWQAVLNADAKDAMTRELAWAEKAFGDSLNFFAPYYHQYTMESIALASDEQQPIAEKVADELCRLFDEYMADSNNGRRFILAGYSQGAQMIPYLLRHMSDEQYSRLVAAYMIGYRLSEEDLKHPHIVAADNADDTGETISFNSVTTVEDRWDFVSSAAAACINPISWTSDVTPAEFEYRGDSATVCVDNTANLLIVSGLDPEKYRFPALERFCTPGNLHHWDLLFWADAIRSNALHRAYDNK